MRNLENSFYFSYIFNSFLFFCCFKRCSKEKLLTIAACIFENFGTVNGDEENGFNENGMFNEVSEHENGTNNNDDGCRYVN